MSSNSSPPVTLLQTTRHAKTFMKKNQHKKQPVVSWCGNTSILAHMHTLAHVHTHTHIHARAHAVFVMKGQIPSYQNTVVNSSKWLKPVEISCWIQPLIIRGHWLLRNGCNTTCTPLALWCHYKYATPLSVKSLIYNQKAPQGGCGHCRQHARLR